MLDICDLRTIDLSDKSDLGSTPLLLLYCSIANWNRTFPALVSAYPPNGKLVALLPHNRTPLGEVSLSQLSGEFSSLVAPFSDRCREIGTEECPFIHLYVPDACCRSLDAVRSLVDVVATLRSPAGCPWDRAQTPVSLTPYILEEAYEAVAAIRSGSIEHTVEELGDLLLQVVLQSQVFSESDAFTLADVANGITAKLIRRHPHVFGPEASDSTDIVDVKRRWEEIKTEEKNSETLLETVTNYALTFPPLLAATKIAKKTAHIEGLNGNLPSLMEQIDRQLTVLRHSLAGDSNDTDSDISRQTLGQLVFLLAQVGQRQGIKLPEALERANHTAIQIVKESECANPLVQAEGEADRPKGSQAGEE